VNPVWKKRLLPPAIVLGAGVIAGALIALGGSAEKTPPTVTPTVVELWTATPETTFASIRGTGVVQPARQVSVIPQVAGRIVYVSPQFVSGGRIAEGEVYARIEDRDYRTAHAAAKSQLRQAELELELEKGRGAVAAREWEMLQAGDTEATPSPLALRQPHLGVAEARASAARTALSQASANLERTQLKAPFNAIVVSEQIDVGQVVAPGAPIAQLVGTDRLWVSVSVPVSQLRDLGISSTSRPNASAVVHQRLGNGVHQTSEAQVLRLGGQLDPQTRHAAVIVAVDDPFDALPGSAPLLPGAYVEVDIEGRPLSDVFRIPRRALYDGKRVWVAHDGVLAAREIAIESGDEESVLVTGELATGEAVIMSALSLPVPGMPVEALN